MMCKAHYEPMQDPMQCAPLTLLHHSQPHSNQELLCGSLSFSCAAAMGTLVLTKEIQSFLLPGALSLPNCGEELKSLPCALT